MQQIPISKILNNTGQIQGLPKNPRFIKDDRFAKLVKSISEDPEMLNLRELIVYPHDGKYIVIAGNMRLRAMKELNYKEAPCKVLDADTPVEKLRAYTIKDNVPYGENDFELLANEWDADELIEWGMELPVFEQEKEAEDIEVKQDFVLNVTFASIESLKSAENDIQELIDRKYSDAFIS